MPLFKIDELSPFPCRPADKFEAALLVEVPPAPTGRAHMDAAMGAHVRGRGADGRGFDGHDRGCGAHDRVQVLRTSYLPGRT